MNPAYTSQDCYPCGHREAKKFSQRTDLLLFVMWAYGDKGSQCSTEYFDTWIEWPGSNP